MNWEGIIFIVFCFAAPLAYLLWEVAQAPLIDNDPEVW